MPRNFVGFVRNFMILSSCTKLRNNVLSREGLMSWMTWVAVLLMWPLVGLAVAYLFGRLTHRGEVYGDAGELAPPVVSYFRRAKRTEAPSPAPVQAKGRRQAAGMRRIR